MMTSVIINKRGYAGRDAPECAYYSIKLLDISLINETKEKIAVCPDTSGVATAILKYASGEKRLSGISISRNESGVIFEFKSENKIDKIFLSTYGINSDSTCFPYSIEKYVDDNSIQIGIKLDDNYSSYVYKNAIFDVNVRWVNL